MSIRSSIHLNRFHPLLVTFNEIFGVHLEYCGRIIFTIPFTGREENENDQHRSKVQVQILRLLEILKNLYVALNFDRSDR